MNIILSLLIIFKIFSLLAFGIFITVLIFLMVKTCIYGEGNFQKLKMYGKYQVGHREFFTTKTNAISCYYPMDRDEY
jgi:hypothetical protein